MEVESWTIDRVERMIADGIEESLHLDYKAAGSLAKRPEKKTEIVKDTTAFANSDGGVIIYGVREHTAADKKHLPSSIDPINRAEISKEWLEQVVSNAAPRIHGVVIHPVSLPDDPSKCLYVVEIPKGVTAHQSLDHKYYRRYNFESVPMEDHEVRDVMNRLKAPSLEIEIFLGIRNPWETNNFLIRARNVSRVIAKRFAFEVKLPIGVGRKLLSVENAIVEDDGTGNYLYFSMGQNSQQTPLFPHGERIFEQEIRSDVRIWKSRSGAVLTPAKEVLVSVFADEMRPFKAAFDPELCVGRWSRPGFVEVLGN